MSAVRRRGAPGPHRFPVRSRPPVSRSTCPPDGSRSALHAHRGPVYVSFVRKSILWDRGLCRRAAHDGPSRRPSLCPRFLSHVKARPSDLRPPCFLSSKSGPQPPSQGTRPLAGPKTQTPDGFLRVNPDRRRNLAPTAGRRSAVVVPCLPLPAAPPLSTFNPTPPRRPSPQHRRRGQQSQADSVPASPSEPPPPAREEEELQDGEPQPGEASQSDWSAGPDLSAPPSPPASVVSHGSLSDFSRPPSSLFSRSTNLTSGRNSVLSADFGDSDPDSAACFSPRPAMQSPLASSPPARSNPRRSPTNTSTAPALYEPQFGRTEPVSPRGAPRQADRPPSRPESAKPKENLPASGHPSLSVDSDHGLLALGFPSTTWSSCPSPQRTTPRSGSGPKLTPPASATRLESHRWPVLPPISPVRGRGGASASRCSELSCSRSHAFDELDAIAPRSTSCPSVDATSDSSCCRSPDADLSPGLAALTVGCDSGNLGSLSRVQLLLLDRLETWPGPFDQEEELSPLTDWPEEGHRGEERPQSVLRPLTAGGASERCDSAGKVRQNKSDQSEGGSGSPSSWIIDPSPSCSMFRSASPPLSPAHDEDGPAESADPGWKSGLGSHGGEEKEERKAKALNMLSKLQEVAPRQPSGSRGRSDFDDFDFLAKYCIFNQEKLAEYKRAFQAEDADGDGYISCLQVLLALKRIIPAELLSDEEEIYVYRILEMVDFRVTDGLVDLRLFAVISSLAQKIATMDDFMRSLISDMDLRSLEVRLFKAKQLFLFLLEEQRGGAEQRGFIGAEQLLLELKAGGIRLEHEAAVRLELQHVAPLDLLDFLAYLPLFMLIHKSVVSNPLDDGGGGL